MSLFWNLSDENDVGILSTQSEQFLSPTFIPTFSFKLSSLIITEIIRQDSEPVHICIVEFWGITIQQFSKQVSANDLCAVSAKPVDWEEGYLGMSDQDEGSSTTKNYGLVQLTVETWTLYYLLTKHSSYLKLWRYRA